MQDGTAANFFTNRNSQMSMGKTKTVSGHYNGKNK